MSKIKSLYRSYCKEREIEFQEYCTGGDKLKELQEFLKSKLNADDYFTAEEMLNDLIEGFGLFTGTAANAHSVVHDDKAQYHASGKQRGGETLQHSDRRA